MRASAAAIRIDQELDAPVRPALSPTDALTLARQNGRLAQALGTSAEDLAHDWQTSVSLDKAVELGWITAAEQRQIEGRATRADLEELGHSPDEIDAILQEQSARR